jgi:hypothetical protein
MHSNAHSCVRPCVHFALCTVYTRTGAQEARLPSRFARPPRFFVVELTAAATWAYERNHNQVCKSARTHAHAHAHVRTPAFVIYDVTYAA